VRPRGWRGRSSGGAGHRPAAGKGFGGGPGGRALRLRCVIWDSTGLRRPAAGGSRAGGHRQTPSGLCDQVWVVREGGIQRGWAVLWGMFSFLGSFPGSGEFPRAEAAYAVLGSMRSRQATLAFLQQSPLVMNFPLFRRKWRLLRGFLGIPCTPPRSILPQGLVLLFGMGFTTGGSGRLQLLAGNDCQRFPAVPEP